MAKINSHQRSERGISVNRVLKKNDVPHGQGMFYYANGGEISGTAYIFSPSCGIQPYQVSGYVERDGRRVVMRGQAPRVSRADCKIFGTKEDELVFERIN